MNSFEGFQAQGLRFRARADSLQKVALDLGIESSLFWAWG